MKISKSNAEHYKWGDEFCGWHLVKSPDLSIIEELMPSGASEKKHYHQKAQQFFRILSGKAIFEIDGKTVVIDEGNGIHIPPKSVHRIRNDENVDLIFLVISQPTTRGDRFDLEE
ncbi:MAG: cupin [Pseudozobellia sp.]|nr:cupin [Pseudozobellia sp.]MBG48776.1 cupin [Pseudozobellia sp.]|tara:strand:+ start:158 stop:502 length:345 start_codon:yes stop_codon:yes gene_type:complete